MREKWREPRKPACKLGQFMQVIKAQIWHNCPPPPSREVAMSAFDEALKWQFHGDMEQIF